MTTYALKAVANINVFLILLVVFMTALVDKHVGYFFTVLGPIAMLFYIRRYFDAFEGAVLYVLQFVLLLIFMWLTVHIPDMGFIAWLFWLIWRIGARWN